MPAVSLEFTGQLVRAPWFYRQWMLAGNPAYFFDRIAKEYGDFVQYRGLFNFYLINHPALVKQVLQETHKNFDKHSIIYDRFRVPFGNGLVVAEGEHWKRQRKLMQPMFVPGAARQFFSLMSDSAHEMTERWRSRCAAQTVFNIADDMNRLTLQIAGRALFHDGFGQAAEQISHWTEVINRFSAKPPLPIVRSSWFPSPLNRNLQKTLIEFREFLQQLIDERRGHSRSTERDLLTILLETRDEESGQPMSNSEVMEEVLGMIIGGHETASSALAWLWYELDQHPHVHHRLVAEIDHVVGQDALSLQHVAELRYTRMVIDETLRLHPPFWFENRNIIREVELGGTRLPARSIVAFSRYSLHRHPAFWHEPEKFEPQRFDPDNEENQRSNCASVPFGYGPRLCIGLNFAMLELMAIVVIVLQKYRVVVAQGNRHEMAARLTMTPRYGVSVQLQSR